MLTPGILIADGVDGLILVMTPLVMLVGTVLLYLIIKPFWHLAIEPLWRDSIAPWWRPLMQDETVSLPTCHGPYRGEEQCLVC